MLISAHETVLFEQLETRQFLDHSPLPTLAMLDDPDNAVVRFETQYGDIDIELLHGAAPQTVATFLTLLRAGEYAGTFAHRLEAGETLRSGLYRFDDDSGQLSGRGGTVFPADAPPTVSNLERTVAMPVTDPTLNPQTTGELVFNLSDNAEADTQFAVFGRVIQGWSAVLQIAGLPVLDLTGLFPFGDPIGSTLNQVPVTDDDPLPTAPSEDLLVSLGDAQLIKPQGVNQFYTERLYFPEGYSWARTFEAIELLNASSDDIHYQILVRYETGVRDQIVATDSIDADRRDTVVISPGFGEPSNIVRNFEPYAYEIWATAPLVAGFRHKDFKTGVGESLPDQAAMREWTFYQSALGFNSSQVFLVWQNITHDDATVEVTYYFENADPITHTFSLEAHRRGGVNLLDVEGLPDEDFIGARVTSDQNIVASITRYDQRSEGNEGDEGGVAALGVPGGGATVGVAPGAAIGSQDPFAVLNASSTDAEITFFITEEGSSTPIERTATVPAGRMMILSGPNNPASAVQGGQFFSVRYVSNTPITAGFITSAFRGTGTAAAVFAARNTHFADARTFTAPAGSPFGQQSLSFFNPNSSSTTVSLVFRSADHAPITLETFSIDAGEATHRRMVDYASLLAQQLSGLGGFQGEPYSISVESEDAIVATSSLKNSDGRTELGMTLNVWEPLASFYTV